jgi:two-component system sensor histidine kinase CiaH
MEKMTKKFWKQLGALATELRGDLFTSARLRLTVYYLFIMTGVLVVFSAVLYFSFAYVLKDNVDTQFPDSPDQGDQAIVQTMSDAKDGIIVIDLTAFALTFVLGYSLAGRTLRPIQDALERQKEFSANASHELRTPLAVMKSDSEVALKNPKTSAAELREVVESNLEEINRMSQITENLLRLARFETIKEKAYFSEIELGEFVKDLANRMKSQASQKGILIEVEKVDSGKILGSRDDLVSVISNLIQNGINYNKPNGIVRISVENNKEEIWLIVEDNGFGISEDDLPYVFERFYKADKSHSPDSSSAGIGLSIVKEIIGKHGGSIEIESALGKGTKISVSFPSASS